MYNFWRRTFSSGFEEWRRSTFLFRFLLCVYFRCLQIDREKFAYQFLWIFTYNILSIPTQSNPNPLPTYPKPQIYPVFSRISSWNSSKSQNEARFEPAFLSGQAKRERKGEKWPDIQCSVPISVPILVNIGRGPSCRLQDPRRRTETWPRASR